MGKVARGEGVAHFKYPKLFQCDNASEFTSNVTKLLKKQNVDT